MNSRQRRGQRGQVIVLMAIALIAVIAMIALIIEGGSAFAQQRVSQNGADAAAKSGALIVAQELAADAHGGGSHTNAEVFAAVAANALANSINVVAQEYTDDFGAPIGTPITNDSGPIPPGAEGVHIVGNRSVGTTFGRVIGIDKMIATADATVVAGPLQGCPAGTDCGVIPVTFPVAVSQCDGNELVGVGAPIDTDGDGIGDTKYWPLVEADEATTLNRATIPLCGTGAGSVGWLDLEANKNLPEEIEDPGGVGFDIPTWIQTQTGNVNAVEDEINDNYAGHIVLVPLFDGYCRVEPTGTALTDCPNPNATGSNTWYHVPWFTAFLVDHAYVAGNNGPECEAAADAAVPTVIADWSGFESCLTGWFTAYVSEGPIVPGQVLSANSVVGIQLIK